MFQATASIFFCKNARSISSTHTQWYFVQECVLTFLIGKKKASHELEQFNAVNIESSKVRSECAQCQNIFSL